MAVVTWLGTNVIETASGLRYDFRNPDVSQISLEDIAHALAHTCRFGGHTREFRSVAEHSLLVADIVARTEPRLAFAALLHDGHEAFLLDVPRPMKPLLQPAYDEMCDRCNEVIGEALGIEVADFAHPAVKAADNLALFHEARAFMPSGGPEEDPDPLPDGVTIRHRVPPLARVEFVERAEELMPVAVG